MAGLVEWVVTNKLTAFLLALSGILFVSTIGLGVAKSECLSKLSAQETTATNIASSTNAPSPVVTTTTGKTTIVPCQPEEPPKHCAKNDTQCLKYIVGQTLNGTSVKIGDIESKLDPDVTLKGNFNPITFNAVEIINFEISDNKSIVIIRIVGAKVTGNITVNIEKKSHPTTFDEALSFIKRVTYSHSNITDQEENADKYITEWSDESYYKTVNKIMIGDMNTEQLKIMKAKLADKDFKKNMKEAMRDLLTSIAENIVLKNAETWNSKIRL